MYEMDDNDFDALYRSSTQIRLILNKLEKQRLSQSHGSLIVAVDGLETTNLNNLITGTSNAENSLTQKSKEEEELKRKIEEMENVRKRADGRYEWRKTIDGVPHQVIDGDPEEFLKKLSAYKKQLKQNANIKKEIKPKESHRLIDLCHIYFNRYIDGQIKESSAKRYMPLLKNQLAALKRDIRSYTKDEIQDFFKKMKNHRNAVISFYFLRNVFKDALEQRIIKQNVMASLKRPPNPVEKGSWIDLKGQRGILKHINESPIGKEIMFYLMTGCRLEEAYDTTIDFNKKIACIKRKKTEDSGISITYMPLSQKFCDYIKDDWHKMFKHKPNYLSKLITGFLKGIGIKNKSTHDLRHTFSSNIYYLGTEAKKHQYLMAHSSIQITYDVYTTLDLTVKKEDIIEIWQDWYPIF